MLGMACDSSECGNRCNAKGMCDNSSYSATAAVDNQLHWVYSSDTPGVAVCPNL